MDRVGGCCGDIGKGKGSTRGKGVSEFLDDSEDDASQNKEEDDEDDDSSDCHTHDTIDYSPNISSSAAYHHIKYSNNSKEGPAEYDGLAYTVNTLNMAMKDDSKCS